jgi:monofunctional biosynthetic peptidoglycan transglycosylase
MGNDDYISPENKEQKPGAEQILSAEAPQRSRLFWRILQLLAYGIVAFMLFSLLFVFLGNFIPPFSSSFMMQQRFSNAIHGESSDIHYQWVRWNNISPHVPLAVVAAEDQKFPQHFGLDLEAIAKARRENIHRQRPRGASTITQQVAKNLYLWPGRSYFRKGLEAYFAFLLELLWSKKRILEVYLNIAEFGPNIYGVRAAAQQFWGKDPAQLTRRQAALLAAVLPNPKRLHADRPSAYVERRVQWIETNISQLGNDYLDDL